MGSNNNDSSAGISFYSLPDGMQFYHYSMSSILRNFDMAQAADVFSVLAYDTYRSVFNIGAPVPITPSRTPASDSDSPTPVKNRVRTR